MTANESDDVDGRESNGNEINTQFAATIANADANAAAIKAQRRRLLRAAQRGDDERWSVATDETTVSIEASPLGGYIEDCSVTVEILPSDSTVALLSRATDGTDGVSTTARLDPGQAEALAVDLLEQAQAVRETDS